MSLKKFEGKSLAECKGLQLTAVRLTAENNYKYVLVQGEGIDFGVDANGKPNKWLCVLLGKALSQEYKVNEQLKRNCLIVRTVNEDGEERWKIGRPTVEFFNAEESPY